MVPVALGGGGGLLALAAAAGVAGVLSGSPPAAAATDQPTTNFRVRIRSGVSVSGLVIGGTVLNVDVQALGPDGEWSTTKKLQFIGAGLSIGANVGVQGMSDWTPITTPRPATLKDFGGFGGIGPLPSANAAIPFTHHSWSADAGTYINIGGPNGPIRNQYLDPEGGTGIGVTVIGAQFGYWRSR